MANNQQLHPLTTVTTVERSNCDKNVTIQTASANAMSQLEVNVLGASLPTNTFLLSPTYGLCSIDQKSVRPLNIACSSISSANKTVGACFVASNGLPLNGESAAAAGSDDCMSPPLTTDGLLNLIPLPSQQQDNQSRFRVVKIESSELLTQRGRWTCVNFSDSAASSVSRGRGCDWLHDDVGYSSGSSISSSGHCGGGVYPLLCVLSDGESPVGRMPAHVNRADTEIVCPPMQSLSTSDLLPAADSAYNTEVAWLTGPSDGRYGLDIDKIRAPLAVITNLDPDNNVTLGNNDDAADGGASAVAIDNKIEQAMDLVKSHLMFAVREEVEVLKEQIKFLMERNEQLEHENSILRAAASRETLDMLNSRQPPLT